MNHSELTEKKMRETFAIRLQNARKMRGFSLQELAKRLEGVVSSTGLDKYEKGLMFPQSSSILVALSQALQVPLGDLLRPITMDIDTGKFEFRKKAKLGKKEKERILLCVKSKIEKYFEIEQILNEKVKHDIDLSDLLITSTDDARKAAMRVREAWNLGTAPINRPLILLESHGVMVIEVEEDPKLFDGTSGSFNGTPIIIINKANVDDSNPTNERKRLTSFHEYAHQVLRIAEGLDEEEICNAFANEMLMPSATFINIVGEKRKYIYPVEMKNLQKEYGISIRALMMKAKQLGIITKNYYQWFCIKLNKQPELKAFVDRNEIETEHTFRFEQMVYRAFGREIITGSKAAELLGISESELHVKLSNA